MYLMASWPALISVAPIGLPHRRWIGITIGDLFTVRQIQRAFGVEAMAVVQSLAVDGVLLSAPICVAATGAMSGFQFEDVTTLDDMQQAIRSRFSLGSSRDELRAVFVTEGNATLKPNPLHSNVEKYPYDINLCGYYIWRWNISADYDQQGKLQQAYVNGEPVFANGTQKRTPKDLPAGTAKILKGTRLRPEASKGESQLSFIGLRRGQSPAICFTIQCRSACYRCWPDKKRPAEFGDDTRVWEC